ncbi:2-succinyl-6-hydroxy-2,4-cyclohexadiene-1-carboxylate synthase [Metabacillus herbersteinensis]|uniref:Putative 2-succinyl-6-hydroxy-2,4-cyclohexadiene-1-carboxylate synthase n=2 Tax=Metabacillus herbersteinensis TaxID=283816 RepID=A0ABV6GJW4_9BACI
MNYHVEVHFSGEPLVLLHGFTGSSVNWGPFLKEFKSYQVVLIDMLGHGRTDSPTQSDRYHMDNVVEDLKVIFEKLNLDSVNLLGYSMGGRIALSFSAKYPGFVKKLILESSSPGLKRMEEREDRIKKDRYLAEGIVKKGVEAFVNDWESIPLFQSQLQLPSEIQSLIRLQRLSNTKIGLSNSLIGMGTGSQSSSWEQLPLLKMPVLLICGELDTKFCEIAKEMDEILPFSTISEINRAGHAIHVEKPRMFGKIVNEFLISETAYKKKEAKPYDN